MWEKMLNSERGIPTLLVVKGTTARVPLHLSENESLPPPTLSPSRWERGGVGVPPTLSPVLLLSNVCCYYNFKRENVWSLGKVWPTILHRVDRKLYKQIKVDMFVADFTRFAFAGFHFLWGSLVVVKAISCFQIVYKFPQVSKSRSLVAVASKYNIVVT